MLDKQLCVLILGGVICIRVHDQLSVWQVLCQDECVDRCDDGVANSVNDKRWMSNVLQGGVTTACRYRSPFFDRGKLCLGRPLRYGKVAVLRARFEPLDVVASCRLT